MVTAAVVELLITNTPELPVKPMSELLMVPLPAPLPTLMPNTAHCVPSLG